MRAALATASLDSFSGICFRATDLEYIEDPLSGMGGLTSNGRYHQKDVCRAVYLSDSVMTMIAEKSIIEVDRHGRVHEHEFAPAAILTVAINLNNVLDLTRRTIRAQIGVTLKELNASWQAANRRGHASPSQAIGTTAFLSGRIHALRVQSAKVRQRTNIVVFPDRLAGDEYLRIVTEA